MIRKPNYIGSVAWNSLHGIEEFEDYLPEEGVEGNHENKHGTNNIINDNLFSEFFPSDIEHGKENSHYKLGGKKQEDPQAVNIPGISFA